MQIEFSFATFDHRIRWFRCSSSSRTTTFTLSARRRLLLSASSTNETCWLACFASQLLPNVCRAPAVVHAPHFGGMRGRGATEFEKNQPRLRAFVICLDWCMLWYTYYLPMIGMILRRQIVRCLIYLTLKGFWQTANTLKMDGTYWIILALTEQTTFCTHLRKKKVHRKVVSWQLRIH